MNKKLNGTQQHVANIKVWQKARANERTFDLVYKLIVNEFVTINEDYKNEACHKARALAKARCIDEGGNLAHYDVPSHPNQNMHEGWVTPSA